MDDVAQRALKLVILTTLAVVFVTGGLWVFLGVGLLIGLAGPMFAGVLMLYVGYDIYDVVSAA